MKQPLIASFLLTLLLPATSLAAEVFSGELAEDLFFPDGVKVLGVKAPEGTPALGTSSLTLDGYGSMTIGDRSTGDFPRISLLGGTTVMSHRDWSNHLKKTWWNGTISAPQPKKKIALRDIPELHPAMDRGVKLEVLGTFRWGLANERFEYSTPARVAFPVEAFDNEKIFTVFEQPNGRWTVNRHILCSAQNKLCVFDVKNVSAVTLVKRGYEFASAENESGGFWSDVFGGDDGDNPEEFFEELLESDEESTVLEPTPESGARSPEPEEAVAEQQPYDEWYTGQVGQKRENIPRDDWRHYRIQYLGHNSDDGAYLRSEEGLSGEELEKVRQINIGKLSRKLRRQPEVQPELEETSNSRFLDYLFAMRNKFGEGEQANVFGQQTEVALDEAPSEEWEEGPRLPSSGPGAFIAIAILGFLLMVVGALRRQ